MGAIAAWLLSSPPFGAAAPMPAEEHDLLLPGHAQPALGAA